MGTVTKALTLLDHFTLARPLIGLSEMARLAGVNKATAFRLLTELQNAGFVEQAGSAREYRLGPAVLRLASLREATVPMREAASTVLRTLADTTGETAHMSLLQGGRLVTTVHALSSRHGTRVTMDDASVLTFHGTGSGLAVLAFLPEPEIKAILSAPLKPHTQETVTDPKRIREQIAEVRRSGIAESVGGFEKDVHSHAAPIFDAEERVMGAIAIAAPVARMTPELRSEIRAALAKGAQELINRLGGHVPAHLRPAA
ncbi:MAG: IclR family transcriptional regulator [Rhodobacteraceae bacterium]|jgi:DNA-binding IclR family transcriptional regulator|nr:IclR family transcriptional regulator [Paracoccaceae bacterium]